MFPRYVGTKSWQTASVKQSITRLTHPVASHSTRYYFASADHSPVAHAPTGKTEKVFNKEESPTKFEKFHDIISVKDLINDIRAQRLGKAIDDYCLLQQKRKIASLTYQNFQDYILLLCSTNKPAMDLLWPVSKIADHLTVVLNDIKTNKLSIDSKLYAVILRFLVNNGQYKHAVDLYQDMQQSGVILNVEGYVSMLICYQKLGELDKAQQLFSVAKSNSRNLNYKNFLAERTLIKIYGQMGQLERSRELRDTLLRREDSKLDLNMKKSIHLAFLDAIAYSGQKEIYKASLEDFRLSFKFDNECHNHVLINLSQLGLYPDLLSYLDNHVANFAIVSPEFRPRSEDHAQELCDLVMDYRNTPISPSTFSDVLFNICKDLRENKHNSQLIEYSRRVFDAYEREILYPFDILSLISGEMKRESQIRILQNPQSAEKVANFPRIALYNSYMRTMNPFVAMAEIYVTANMLVEAISVLRQGVQYQRFRDNQLKRIFGIQAKDISALRELVESSNEYSNLEIIKVIKSLK